MGKKKVLTKWSFFSLIISQFNGTKTLQFLSLLPIIIWVFWGVATIIERFWCWWAKLLWKLNFTISLSGSLFPRFIHLNILFTENNIIIVWHNIHLILVHPTLEYLDTILCLILLQNISFLLSFFYLMLSMLAGSYLLTVLYFSFDLKGMNTI